MKSFAFFTVFGLIAVAQAQEQCAAVAAKIPTCAITCIASAASGVGCSQTDFACQCKPANNAAINSAALDCVVKGCGAAQGLAVQGSASAVCACAATAAGSSPTSAAAAAPVEASSTAESSPTNTAAVPSIAAPATSSAPFPTTTAAAAPVASAPSASGTGGVNASSSVTPFTGAAVKVAASLSAAISALLVMITVL
ncbi:hypothetical protein ACLMJK_004707 [Lecanora helva]